MKTNVFIVFVTAFAIARADILSTRKCENHQFECDNGRCIEKRYWCNDNYGYRCSDNSNMRNCNSYPNCTYNQTACLPSRKCLPLKWACDDYVDCPDGSDETDCMDGYKREDRIKFSKTNARTWLLKQRRGNYGWEGRTHRAVTALYLSDTKQFYPSGCESNLMMKQLQLYLSQVILRGKPIPAYETALYVHSLLSTCINPRSFQYRDFIQELKKSLEESSSFNPFVALVLCNANAALSSETIVKLSEVMNQTGVPEWIEQTAYALMTVSCIEKRGRYPEASGDVVNSPFFSNASISDATRKLKFLQRNNGSFGNLHTTALVMQALQAIGDSGKGWDSINAFRYLLSEQRSDGSFDDDILTTYLVLPVLNKKSLADLGNVSCPSNESDDLTAKDELELKDTNPQKITYRIIVGLAQDITFSITFSVPEKSTLFDAMRFSEELDRRYRFKYIPYPWGNYVYSLFGIRNDPEAGLYWQLYQMKNNTSSLVEKAPDKLIIEDNGNYAYWYRPTNRIIGNRTDEKKIDLRASILNELLPKKTTF